MKSLYEYLCHIKENNCEDKEITFDFTDLEGAEDILKELADKDSCDIDDNKLTISVNSGNYDKLASVQDILQKYTQKIRTSIKRSENELYAQKTVKFEKQMNKLNETIQCFSTPEETPDKEEE